MMIINLIKYTLNYYLKTFKYIVPTIFFIIFLSINYGQSPIVIWDNYSITPIAMFLLTIWITMTFLSFEDIVQQQLIILHIGKDYVYYLIKILAIWIFMMIFNVIICIFPVIFNMFNRKVTVQEFIIVLLIHGIYSLLGICITLLFDSRLLKNKKIALELLFILIVIIMSQNAIIEKFKSINYVKFILPSIYFVYDKLQYLKDNVITFSNKNLILFVIYSLIYCFTIIFIYIRLIIKKKF